MMYAKFKDGKIVKANKIYSPEGSYDAKEDNAPDGWYKVESEGDITDVSINGIPLSISRMRAMLVLEHMDLLDTVINMINGIGGDTKIAFENALEFERDSTFIATMTEALELTSEQVDSMYIEASELEVN